MRLVIRDDYPQLARFTAEYIARRVTEAAPTPAKPFVLALPSGSTATLVYRRLVELHESGRLDLAHVVCFGLDEYVGIPRDHPNSQHTYMWKHLFSRVNVPAAQAHMLDGNAADLEAECARYEAAVAANGGIDLAFFSTGADGHVARNEPGSSLGSGTRPKTLAWDTLQQLAGRWGCSPAEVPNVTLTMGMQTLLGAREVVVVFSGSNRAKALEAALERGVNHMFPVSVFQKHAKVLFVCDEDATLELRMKTVAYFKGLDETARRLQPLTTAQEEEGGEEEGEEEEAAAAAAKRQKRE